MELEGLFERAKLIDYIARGLVHEGTCADDPTLKIYNYTAKTQFENLWDEVTMTCRGLIVRTVNGKSVVVARPFKKFFNLNTERFPETMLENLPAEAPEVTEKFDGWLGILYEGNYGHKRIATRGSFGGPAPLWATSFLRQRTVKGLDLPENHTALFEIIHPKLTRVVCEYDYQDLILLGLVNNETGEQLRWGDTHDWAEHNNLNCTPAFNLKPADTIRQVRQNHEGYVLTWPIAGTTPLKVKVKHEDYIRLHRVLTNCNNRGIWSLMAEGADISPLKAQNLPLDFVSYVKQTELGIQWNFDETKDKLRKILATCPFDIKDCTEGLDRKHFAIWAKNATTGQERLLPLVFAFLDGKNWKEGVWKLVRPERVTSFQTQEAEA